MQVLHDLVAIGVELGLCLDVALKVAQVIGLDGAEALHQEPRDLRLFVVLGLGQPELILSLKK